MKRACDSCGTEYLAKRPNSRYCSDTCRKRGSRGIIATAITSDTPSASPEPVSASIRVALESADRLDTWQGQLALNLAQHLDQGSDTGSARASCAKQLSVAMDVAMQGVGAVADSVDELRQRRDSKRADAG